MLSPSKHGIKDYINCKHYTFNTMQCYSMCFMAAMEKGQREHGSVEMLDAWTMNFPYPYLKDRVLLPVDKTLHLATRALGCLLSGEFPTRPCGQAFHHFPSYTLKPIFSYPICSLSLTSLNPGWQPQRNLCTTVHTRDFFSFLLLSFYLVCNVSLKNISSDSFILFCLTKYNTLITWTQLGFEHL